jgi:hypothetical protein
MTGYQTKADASDELCPYLTDAEVIVPGPRAAAAVADDDELCPHLTDEETSAATAVATLPARVRRVERAEHTERARRGFGVDARAVATAAPPWVRPYVLTGGRTRTHNDLLVHTLVSVPDYSASLAAQLPPEARLLYERAHGHTESVAELSAHSGIPLGVTRVLLSDLIAAGHVLVGPEPYDSPYDSDLLERIIDGLQQFV